MYKSPIDVMIADIQHQIAQQQDEEIYKAVVSVGINVDKDELIRALRYDRDQYAKGYADGTRDAEQKWIPVTERLPEESGLCLVYTARGTVMEMDYSAKYKQFNMYDDGIGTPIACTYWMPLPEPPKGE